MRTIRLTSMLVFLLAACTSPSRDDSNATEQQFAKIEADLALLHARVAALETRATPEATSDDARHRIEETDRRRIEELDARVRAADAMARAQKDAIDDFLRAMERRSDANNATPMETRSERLRRSLDRIRVGDQFEVR